MVGKLVFAVAGVFVGAFAVEYLRRKNPELLERVRRSAGEVADRLFPADEDEQGEAEPAEPAPAEG
jgi:hypothetical protein